MLKTFINSYENSVFTDDYKCPYSRAKIEAYAKILHPLFKLTNMLQPQNVSIGDLVPMLLMTIHEQLSAFVSNTI